MKYKFEIGDKVRLWYHFSLSPTAKVISRKVHESYDCNRSMDGQNLYEVKFEIRNEADKLMSETLPDGRKECFEYELRKA